jgi:DNA mismatch repair protein MutL
VLSTHTAAKIAAGEVIERPASVVKELVENSLDAGASQVIVEVQDGGIRSIRVTDDGIGIPSDQVALAFHRHATSKIDDEWDLQSIETLGFRGEALPSIAAVSSVTLVTREAESAAGHRIKLSGSRVVEEGPVGCPIGTSVSVLGLFSRVPARRKFLRSPNAEGARIGELMSRLAMAFPGVRFRLVANGKESLNSPGNGSLLDVLAAIYGTKVGQALLEVGMEDDGYNVTGFVSPPTLSRANRSHITFLVNRRWVQSRLLSIAVEQAYHGLLMQRRYPIAVLNLNLPAEDVDINVHPSKREVRFTREDRAFQAVQRAVRSVLVVNSPVPDVSLERLVPSSSPHPAPTPTISLKAPTPASDEGRQESFVSSESLARLRVMGQMGDVYVVAEGPDGLYLIDQHAAHERVLFEQVRDAVREGVRESQVLLEPASVELTYTQQELARESREALEQYGFVLEEFGERSYLLRGVPSALNDSDPAQGLREVLDLMSTEFRLMERRDGIAASIACHGAIRAGKSLGTQEMTELVRQLEGAENPNTCPHGRPTMIRLSVQHLERQFGRR